MNKETQKLYNWLLEKPGYIKNSIEKILEKYPRTDKLGSSAVWNGLEALKQAKIAKKKEIKPNKKLKSAFVKLEQGIAKLNPSKLRNIPGIYFVSGCHHSPWHNKLMFEAIFRYFKIENIILQGLILAGDFLDLNSLSSHDKGKTAIEGVTLDWEYKEANKFLDQFDNLKYNKGATKDFLYGNHCDRYLRLMKNNDESKYGSALKSPEEGLNLKKREYNVYTNWKNDCISIGQHLDVCHGEFCNTFSSKKMIDTYRKSMMYVHTHRKQTYIEGMVGGWNIGSGADFSAPIFGYATRAMLNSWVNDCALVYLDKEGFYHVQSLMFINNKLVVNGKEY